MRQIPVFALVLVLALAVGCAGQAYRVEPPESTAMLSRAQTQESGGLRVRAAVPTPEEAEAILGIPVYERRVQPVWLEVRNTTPVRVRFAPVGMDRAYFSPMEIWYTNRGALDREGGVALQRRIHDLTMPRQIPSGQTRSGFVFTHADPGTKSFNVDLFGVAGQDESFTFFIDVPGFVPDHAEIDPRSLFAPEDIRRVTEAGLAEALAALPCCATDAGGAEQGLPVNAIFVGQGPDVLTALLRANWYEIARPSTPSEVSSASHLFGRVPDAVFRLRRGGASERNELRVWMAPIRVGGDPVWVAQMTHYIGRLTRLGTAVFDARLDPDVDEARTFLLQRLWYSQALRRFTYVSGERLDTAGDLSAFFRGSRYFSDGYRVLLWVSPDPVSLLEVENLHWADPPPRSHEEIAR